MTEGIKPQPIEPAPAKQSGYRIKSVTVSLEIADKEYGSGNSGFASLQAHVDDAQIEQIQDVINAGLSLFVAAWEIILGGKLAVKLNSLTPTETQQTVMNVRHRLGRVQALLHDARKTHNEAGAADNQ